MGAAARRRKCQPRAKGLPYGPPVPTPVVRRVRTDKRNRCVQGLHVTFFVGIGGVLIAGLMVDSGRFLPLPWQQAFGPLFEAIFADEGTESEAKFRDRLFRLVGDQSDQFTLIDQSEFADFRKSNVALLQPAFETRYRLNPDFLYFFDFVNLSQEIVGFYNKIRGLHGSLHKGGKTEQSQPMTIGLELEMRAKGSGHEEGNGLGMTAWVGEDRFPDSVLRLRRLPILANDYVSLTLDQTLKDSKLGIFELKTEESATSPEAFRISVANVIAIAQHLLHFINQVQNPTTNKRGASLLDFRNYYNGAVEENKVSADFPELEIFELEDPKKKGRMVTMYLPPRPDRAFEPRLDPQITFTIPLERVTTFYRSTAQLFPLPESSQNRAQRTIVGGWNVRELEQAAAGVGDELVASIAPAKGNDQHARKAQKLRGFFSILALYALTVRFGAVRLIDLAGAHSTLGKNSYGFLPKVSLHRLYHHGLSAEDRLSFQGGLKNGELLKKLSMFVQGVKAQAPARVTPIGIDQSSKSRYLPMVDLSQADGSIPELEPVPIEINPPFFPKKEV